MRSFPVSVLCLLISSTLLLTGRSDDSGGTSCLEQISSSCADDLIASYDGEELLKRLLSDCGLHFNDHVSLSRGWAFVGVDVIFFNWQAKKLRVCFDNSTDTETAVEVRGTHVGWDTSEKNAWRYDVENDAIVVSHLDNEEIILNEYKHVGKGAFVLRRYRYTNNVYSLGLPRDAAIPLCVDDPEGWKNITGCGVSPWWDPFVPGKYFFSFVLSVIDYFTLGVMFEDDEPLCADVL